VGAGGLGIEPFVDRLGWWRKAFKEAVVRS